MESNLQGNSIEVGLSPLEDSQETAPHGGRNLPTDLSLEMVVARYYEDIAWTKQVAWPTTIYNKGDGTENVLPNVGREAHTYLHHILTRYDQLADRTAFCQGHPFDHCPDLLERLAIERGEWAFLAPQLIFCNKDGLPNRMGIDMRRSWAAIFPDQACADLFLWGWGAQFIVSRERIHRHAPSFYEKILALTLKDIPMADVLERMWPLIFGVDPIQLKKERGSLRALVQNPAPVQKSG